MSFERIKRAENVRVAALDKGRTNEGANGIGKPFELRKPDWRAMMAMNYGPSGRRIAQ